MAIGMVFIFLDRIVSSRNGGISGCNYTGDKVMTAVTTVIAIK